MRSNSSSILHLQSENVRHYYIDSTRVAPETLTYNTDNTKQQTKRQVRNSTFHASIDFNVESQSEMPEHTRG